MKIKCIAVDGKSLLDQTLKFGGYSVEMDLYGTLKQGSVYSVYGISLYKGVLAYLIVGENTDYPSWYPAELFEVTDNQIPFEWSFEFFKNLDLKAVLGYKELVLSDDHYDNLMERDEKAIRIFLERKKCISFANKNKMFITVK